MFLEIDFRDGSQQKFCGDASEIKQKFALIVGAFCDNYSTSLCEVRLYDNAHRLFKVYSQLF